MGMAVLRWNMRSKGSREGGLVGSDMFWALMLAPSSINRSIISTWDRPRINLSLNQCPCQYKGTPRIAIISPA